MSDGAIVWHLLYFGSCAPQDWCLLRCLNSALPTNVSSLWVAGSRRQLPHPAGWEGKEAAVQSSKYVIWKVSDGRKTEMKTSRGKYCKYKREEAVCGECRNPQRTAEFQSKLWHLVGMWVSLTSERSSLELSAPLSKLQQECEQRGRFCCAQRWADGCQSVEEILLAF